MIKLFVTDIDDTLTKNAREIPEENYRAIRRALDAGLYVSLATGRGYKGTQPVIEALGLESYVICYGGAVIMDAKNGEPVMTSEVDNALLHESLDLAAQMGVHAQIYQGDCIISAEVNAPTEKPYHTVAPVQTAMPRYVVAKTINISTVFMRSHKT